MKYPQTVSMPSTVSMWFEEQLEARGIDAVVYTRYILSLLRSHTVDVIFSEEDLHLSPLQKEVGKWNSGRKRSHRSSSDWWRHAHVDAELIKRSAAVKCLLSATDQNCEIESLIDELCEKLKQAREENENPTVPSATPSSQRIITPQELAEKYYEAFPPLCPPSLAARSPKVIVNDIHKKEGTLAKKQLRSKENNQEMNSTLSNPAPAYPRLPQDDAQDDGNGIPENDLQILNVDLNEIIRRLREPAEERTPRADEIEESAEGEENAEEDETSEENESSEEDESSEEEVKEAEKKEMSENVEEEVEEDLFPNLIADIERLLITPPPAKENDGDDEATRDIPQNLPMPSRSEYVPYRGQNPHNSILTVSERNPLLMCRNTDAEDLKALTTPLTIDTSVGNYDPPTGDARVTRDQLLLQPVEPRKNSSTLITSEPMVMDKLPHLMQNFFANNKPGSIAPQLYNPFGADSCFQFSKNYGSGNLDDQRCESQCGQDCDDSPDSASCGRNEDGAEEAENLVGEPEPEQCKFPINENCQMLLARKIQLGPICPPSKAAATDKEPQPLSLPTAPYSSARWMYKESKKSSLDYIEKLVTERQADSICTWPPQVYNMSITCRQQHRLVGHVEDVLEFEPLMPLMALIGADDADNSGRNSPADIGGIPWPPNEEEVVRVPWPRREGDDEPREEPRQEDDEPADAMPIREGNDGAGGQPRREGNDGAGGQPRREGNDGAGGQPSTGGNDAEGGPVHPPTESNETGARPRSSGNVPVVDDAVAGCSGINVESPRAGPSNDGDEADGAWSLPLMANAEIDEDFLRALWDDDMCRFEPFLVSDPELINEMRKDWENEISQLIAVQTTALRSFDHLFQPPRPGDESRHLRFMNQQEEPAQPSEEDEENKQPTDQPPSDKPMI